MTLTRWLAALMLCFAGAADLHATPPPIGTEQSPGPPPESDRASMEVRRQDAQHGQRVDLVELPVLDPAIFTGISPYSATQDAVRLPDDQRLD
jgi:hypothetical protein